MEMPEQIDERDVRLSPRSGGGSWIPSPTSPGEPAVMSSRGYRKLIKGLKCDFSCAEASLPWILFRNLI